LVDNRTLFGVSVTYGLGITQVLAVIDATGTTQPFAVWEAAQRQRRAAAELVRQRDIFARRAIERGVDVIVPPMFASQAAMDGWLATVPADRRAILTMATRIFRAQQSNDGEAASETTDGEEETA
jgi:hypothetical protein